MPTKRRLPLGRVYRGAFVSQPCLPKDVCLSVASTGRRLSLGRRWGKLMSFKRLSIEFVKNSDRLCPSFMAIWEQELREGWKLKIDFSDTSSYMIIFFSMHKILTETYLHYVSLRRCPRNKSVGTTMRLKWTFWDIWGHLETFWDILGHIGTIRKTFWRVWSI